MGKKSTNFFQKGTPFDALVMDAKIPIFNVCAAKNLTSTIVYASDVSMHRGTMVNGRWVIQKGEHPQAEVFQRDFMTALKTMNNR